MPPAASYDGMPQYSNGIGMTRDFLDGWAKGTAAPAAGAYAQPTSLTLVCGTLIAPIPPASLIDRLEPECDQLDARLLPGGQSVLWATCHRVRAADGTGCCAAYGPVGRRALLPRVMSIIPGRARSMNIR